MIVVTCDTIKSHLPIFAFATLVATLKEKLCPFSSFSSAEEIPSLGRSDDPRLAFEALVFKMHRAQGRRLRRNLSCVFGQTESTSAVKFRPSENNA